MGARLRGRGVLIQSPKSLPPLSTSPGGGQRGLASPANSWSQGGPPSAHPSSGKPKGHQSSQGLHGPQGSRGPTPASHGGHQSSQGLHGPQGPRDPTPTHPQPGGTQD